jgi:beta-lactamase superfamily II metal-dependent hydrolase
MTIRYVQKFSTSFEVPVEGHDPAHKQLIWGDPCEELEVSGTRTRVRARGEEGWVTTKALGDSQSLLEIYVIDVGQGDGVLMKTPDEKWHLIDAGVNNSKQMTKKGAANFLAWKFLKELGRDRVKLDSVILSHPDSDHYGGLLNVMGGYLPPADRPERRFEVEVDTYYHCGVGRFTGANPLGVREPGTLAEPFPQGAHGLPAEGSFITELLDGLEDFRDPAHPFIEEFAALAELVTTVPRHVRRLDASHRHLPGYGPGSDNGCEIHVLGPIIEQLEGGGEGLRWLENLSKTSNGHSIVLRVDYKDARILLTGDLNEKSQQLLLSYQPAEEFTVDVAKGCHHGSDDISLDFVKAMGARATIISSGDNEDHAHPRPRVMGASARYGREAVDVDGTMLPPLLYSTELARSVKLAYAERISVRPDGGGEPANVAVDPDHPLVVPAGGARQRPLARAALAVDLVYGLVNVRTDGKTILVATMEEKGSSFDIRVFRAGQSPE